MKSHNPLSRCAGSLIVAVGLVGWARPARADQMTIKNPGEHPSYFLEAEPHGLVGFLGPFDKGSVGAGFRASLNLLDEGFLGKVNDSVGITFGGDFFFDGNRLFVPVAMQWNFWLSRKWSVFGEPGVAFEPGFKKGHHLLDPLIMAGGRFHFSDGVALTLRAGYPAVSVGISFLL